MARPWLVLATPGGESRARSLAERLGTDLTDHVRPGQITVVVGPRDLAVDLGDDAPPVRVDLAAAATQRADRQSPLARAIGVDRGVRTVVDTTAGWGRDAATLSALGLEVTMIERHPVIVALLEDGLRRAPPELAARLTLAPPGDAVTWLENQDDRPDAIFVDPMYEQRHKAALPRRELAVFRSILPASSAKDLERLVDLARRRATRRVVVKRPPRQRPCGKPIATVASPKVAFDLYAPTNPEPT